MQPYIVGNVITCDGQEHIAGIKVTLKGVETRSAMETLTDFEGGFAFCGLTLDTTYIVKAQVSGLKTDEVVVKLKENLDLGSLVLTQI